MVTKQRKPRRCSYCRDEGHDRRTCAPLRRDKSKAAEVNRRFVDLVVEDMVERGIGPGALIEFTIPSKETTDGEPTPLAMVTDLHWEQLFYRKPGRRWVSIKMMNGVPNYHIGSTIRRVKFPQHELDRTYDSKKGTYIYSEVLKPHRTRSADRAADYSSYPFLSSGEWNVISPVTISKEALVQSQPLGFYLGWNGIDDYFLDLNIESCHQGSYYLEKRRKRL